MSGLMTSELGSWRVAFRFVGAAGFFWLILWFALVRASGSPWSRTSWLARSICGSRFTRAMLGLIEIKAMGTCGS